VSQNELEKKVQWLQGALQAIANRLPETDEVRIAKGALKALRDGSFQDDAPVSRPSE